MKAALRYTLIAAALLLGGCFALRQVSEPLLFPAPPPQYKALPGLVMIPGDGAAQFAAVHLANPAARHLVLFFHGNGDDLAATMPRLEALQRAGFAVLAVDYPGYGRTGGAASEEGFYASAAAALRHATGELGWPRERIIAHGVSLGGAAAIWLAARERLGGLIAESAFISAYRVMLPFSLPGDRMPNLARMRSVACPVLVIHGTRDTLIPFSHGQALLQAAAGPKREFWVAGAGHNDVVSTAGPRYWSELQSFAASLP